MWVNKSVNPSQTSTRAAQAAPPRMTPGTVYAAGCATHTALRADLRRNGSEGQSLPPRAGRGKHLETTLGGPAQAPAGLSSQATEPAHGLGPAGFNLPSLRSACRKVKGTCSTSPRAATCCTLKPVWPHHGFAVARGGRAHTRNRSGGLQVGQPIFWRRRSSKPSRQPAGGAARPLRAPLRPVPRFARAAASVAPLVCHAVLQHAETPPENRLPSFPRKPPRSAPGVRLKGKTGAAERAEGGRQLRRPPMNR